jgi:S1 RNA binding domain protein
MIKSGDKLKVKIASIASFGAFCDVLGNEEGIKGLIHISEFSDYFVNDINEFVKVGDECEVSAISYDETKKQVKLSFKATHPENLKSADKPKLQENGSGFKELKTKVDKHVADKNK